MGNDGRAEISEAISPYHNSAVTISSRFKGLNFHPHTVSYQVIYIFRKNGKIQKRGRINMIGRLQLSTERSKEEDNEGIIQLRILRTQVQFSHFICISVVYLTEYWPSNESLTY